jgi:hypothetical protein
MPSASIQSANRVCRSGRNTRCESKAVDFVDEPDPFIPLGVKGSAGLPWAAILEDHRISSTASCDFVALDPEPSAALFRF